MRPRTLRPLAQRVAHSLDVARASTELVALRLRLPARFATQPVDALLTELTARDRAPHADAAALERALDRVEAVLARVPSVPRTCLYRSLARYVVLRRRGVAATFVLGLPADGSDGPGHAWVERGDGSYKDPLARAMIATYRFPEATAS